MAYRNNRTAYTSLLCGAQLNLSLNFTWHGDLIHLKYSVSTDRGSAFRVDEMRTLLPASR